MRETLAAAAVLFIFTTAASVAADLAPTYTKAPPAAVYGWTGFYIGGNIGGGVASSHFDDPGFFGSSATATDGFFTGGAQIGYNYQFGAGLIGVEADVNGNSTFKGSVIGANDTISLATGDRADVSGTIRGRAGLVMSNALIYVTGGAAWADLKQTGVAFSNFGASGGPNANSSGTSWGGVIGAGVEFAMSPNWTVGAEFLHTLYEDHDAALINVNGASACGIAANCAIRNQLTTDVARVRFNYKWGQ
jgi:opacity protein-like surface antigen